MIEQANTLFEEVMDWLKDSYADHRFFVERDLVWTLQKKLNELIQLQKLPLNLYNDYGILPGKRRRLSVDLAILHDETVVLAIEFKYEPSHQREDIPKEKFPVVDWKEGVLKDLDRVQEFVTKDKAKRARSVLIDEGGYFRKKREAPEHCTWADWGNDLCVLQRIVAGNSR